MFIRYIPIIIFVLSILTINITYFMAASYEHVSWCIPYIDGCTSISATGRQAPESYVFRATIMPVAVLTAWYWMLNYRWLAALGDKNRWPSKFILFLGILAAFFLIVYTSVLGAIGDNYQTLRRIGVTSYFSFTFLAQLILTSRVWHLKSQHIVMTLGKVPEAQLLLCGIMLTLGLLSTPLAIYLPEADNIVEWNFTVLMNAYFLTSYFAWKSTAFCINYSVKSDGV